MTNIAEQLIIENGPVEIVELTLENGHLNHSKLLMKPEGITSIKDMENPLSMFKFANG